MKKNILYSLLAGISLCTAHAVHAAAPDVSTDPYNNPVEIRERLREFIEYAQRPGVLTLIETIYIIDFLAIYIRAVISYVYVFKNFQRFLQVPLDRYPDYSFESAGNSILLEFPATVYILWVNDIVNIRHFSLKDALNAGYDELIQMRIHKDAKVFLNNAGDRLWDYLNPKSKSKAVRSIASYIQGLGFSDYLDPLRPWIADMYDVDNKNYGKFIQESTYKDFQGPRLRDWFYKEAQGYYDMDRPGVNNFFARNLFVQPIDTQKIRPVQRDFSGILTREDFLSVKRDILGAIPLIEEYKQAIEVLLSLLPKSHEALTVGLKKEGISSQRIDLLKRKQNIESFASVNRSILTFFPTWADVVPPLVDGSVERSLDVITPYFVENRFFREEARIVDFVKNLDVVMRRMEIDARDAQVKARSDARRARAEALQREFDAAIIDFDKIEKPPVGAAPEEPLVEQEGTSQVEIPRFIVFSARYKNLFGIEGNSFKVECFVHNATHQRTKDSELEARRISYDPRVTRWDHRKGSLLNQVFDESEYKKITNNDLKALVVMRHDFCKNIDTLISTHGTLTIDGQGTRRVIIPGIMRITPLQASQDKRRTMYGYFEYVYDKNFKLYHRYFNSMPTEKLTEMMEEFEAAQVSATGSSATQDPKGKGKMPV